MKNKFFFTTGSMLFATLMYFNLSQVPTKDEMAQPSKLTFTQLMATTMSAYAYNPEEEGGHTCYASYSTSCYWGGCSSKLSCEGSSNCERKDMKYQTDQGTC